MADRRPAGTLLLAATLAALPARAADTAIPEGFGTLALGAPWAEVEALGGYTDLTRATSEWERHVHACGYRSAQVVLEQGRLLVTAQDSVITALSYVTPIRPGSRVMQVADLVIKSYGQPRRATLRDALGVITLDAERASHVVLEYPGPPEARFAISGDPLWEYRISIQDRAARRLENRTLRCAREREKAAAAKSSS